MADQKDLFISHATKDKPLMHRLAARLIENGVTVWADEAEIRSGESITGAINRGLETSRRFVPLLTPSYFESASGWTDAEWHATLFGDPDNRQGKVIPVLAADTPSIPILLRHLLRIDIRGDHFEFGAARLVEAAKGKMVIPVWARGVETTNGAPTRRALSAALAPILPNMDQIDERLSSNLIPLIDLPTEIYAGRLKGPFRAKPGGEFPSKKILCDRMISSVKRKEGPARRIPPFRSAGDWIYSFFEIGRPGSPFRTIVDAASVKPFTPNELAKTEDGERIVTSLLNLALQNYCRSLGLMSSFERGRGWRYFFTCLDGSKPRKIGWTPGIKKTERTVAKPLDAERPEKEWLHAGAYLDICRLGGKTFLKLRPTWVVTEDGRDPKTGTDVGKIVNRWTNKERNLTLLYHVRFWTTILSKGAPEIVVPAGREFIRFARAPAQIHVPFGIKNDQTGADKLLDLEAKLMEADEFDLVERAWTYLGEQEWDETEDDENNENSASEKSFALA